MSCNNMMNIYITIVNIHNNIEDSFVCVCKGGGVVCVLELRNKDEKQCIIAE